MAESYRAVLRCPSCGSTEIDEFRMGLNRYRISNGAEGRGQTIRDSEDVFFHSCPDCGYGSSHDEWEPGDDDTDCRSPFVRGTEVMQ